MPARAARRPAVLALSLHVASAAGAAPAPGAAPPRAPDLLNDRVVLRLPGMDDVQVQRDLEWTAADGTTLRMDLFKPKGSTTATRLPVVVFVNGVGGTDIPLRRWGVYQSWARLVAVSGMAAILHDARGDKAMDDLVALVDHARAQAGALGLDPDAIAVWASSANVNVGFPYAADPSRTFLRAAVFYYGSLDKDRVRQDLPVMVVRAGLDQPWANGPIDAYSARALALDAPVTILNLPGAIHAFDVFDDNEQSRHAVRATLDFLRANLSPDMQAARLVRADAAKGIYFTGTGDAAAAVRHLDAHLATAPDDRAARMRLADALYKLGEHAKAGDAYERLGEAGWVPGVTFYNAACCRALKGDKESALRLLARALDANPRMDREQARKDPDLASLLQDPRFEEVLTAPRAAAEAGRPRG
jgi:dienelactone hydrolase